MNMGTLVMGCIIVIMSVWMINNIITCRMKWISITDTVSASSFQGIKVWSPATHIEKVKVNSYPAGPAPALDCAPVDREALGTSAHA